METTLGIIKPDAVDAGHIGEIITMIERSHGLAIGELESHHNMHLFDAETLYAEHKGKFFYKDLLAFITSGPCVLLELGGPTAIATWREMMGATNSAKAAAGTIRSLWGSVDPRTMYNNCVHGSDSPEAARRELELFFGSRL